MGGADDIRLFWEIFNEDPRWAVTEKYRYLAESYQGKITILSDISGREERRVKREVEKALKKLKPRTAKDEKIIRNAIKEMEKRWQQQFGFTEETMQLLGRKVEESCIIFEHEGIVSYGLQGFGLCEVDRVGVLHVNPDLWIASGDKFYFPLYVRYAANVAWENLCSFLTPNYIGVSRQPSRKSPRFLDK